MSRHHFPIASLLICVAFALCSPNAAHAIDQKKVAVALAQRAAQAFETGDMAKAAEGYNDAYRNDPSEPNYLYGAARAEQSGHLYEKAERHFREFISLPGVDPARVVKAKGYLADVLAQRSDLKADEAAKAAAGGDRVLAVAAYLEAWRLAPSRHQLLLKAALIEREIGGASVPSAIGHLQDFLHAAPPDAPERETAQAVLKALQQSQPQQPEAKLAVVKKPESPPQATPQVQVVEQPAQTQPWNSATTGWWTIGGGAALAIVGGVVGLVALGDAKTLQGQITVDANGAHSQLTHDEVASQASKIGARETAGLVMACVGVAASGVGTWLVLRSPDAGKHVSLTPTATGLLLSGRF